MASILFISLMNSDAWGGSEVLWFSTAKYAIQKGDNVTCLVYDWPEKKQKLQELQSQGAVIVYIPNYGRAKKNLQERLYFELITRLHQKLFIAKFNFAAFDFVVVNQGGFMDVVKGPWKQVYQKLPPYVLTFHNYSATHNFSKKEQTLLQLWIDNACKAMVAANKIADVITAQIHSIQKPFAIFFNPLSIQQTNGITAFPLLHEGNYKIIMLAQLDVNRKAQDNLIKALANPIWKNRNYVLEIYGDGEHFNLLNKLIVELDLTNKVFLKGKTNTVALVLEQAHLVLQITHADAMPISVIEAMSKSRAVIVSDVGDMPLWIKNNETGWVALNATVEAITNVLEIAWQNREHWEAMGKNAFQFFDKHFPTMAEEQFYNQLVNCK
jgi:glycosyltransferase involved in cell wall biosynthesis